MSAKVATARRLRRNQTDAERVLWFRLRDRRLNGLKFKRQVPIAGYIADFCCDEARLIIEVDGGQHALQDETKRSAQQRWKLSATSCCGFGTTTCCRTPTACWKKS